MDLPDLTAEEWASLSDAEQDELLACLEGMSGGESLRDFIVRMSPHHPAPRHLYPIIAELERAQIEPVRVLVSLPPGHAKLVADSTPILTPDGWRTHGDLRVGDRVYAPDGTATRIAYVTEKGLATLAVRFSDGSEIKVNPGHRWRVFDKSCHRWKVMETHELASAGLSYGRQRNGSPRPRFMLEEHKPVAGAPLDLPIDPYIFGLWLGDGTAGNGRITASPADAERFMEEARARGYQIGAVNVHSDTGVVTFCVLGMKVRSVVGLAKFIPSVYFRASEEQRRELLRGLVDSDGCVDPKRARCRFVNVDARLAGDVTRLVASLGYVVTTDVRPATVRRFKGYTSECRASFCVSWSPTDGSRPSRLPRKDHRMRALSRRRSIRAIEACAPEEGHCIAVDHPGHVYLVGDKCVPTHNTTLFVNAIAWWLARHPADPNGYYSYNNPQAYTKSVLANELSKRAGVQISKKSDSKSEWRTTVGGGLLAGGIGSGLTGQRIKGMLIVDDPFKGPVDAYSQVGRDNVFEWFMTVAMTRLEGASVFVIQTRWHEDDLIGRLEKTEGWKVINMPAIAEQDDILGRAVGDPLWPELYPLSALQERKDDLGEYRFAALFQGRPRPRGGTVFGEAHYYDPLETSFEGCRTILMADPAASQKTSADYSAVVVLSIRDTVLDDGTRYITGYVRYVYREQKTIPQFVRELLAIQERWGMTPIGVECVGAFLAIPQMLRELGVERIREVVPIGDKFTRAQPAAAAWNIGRLLVPAYDEDIARAQVKVAALLGPMTVDPDGVFSSVEEAQAASDQHRKTPAPKWLGKYLDEMAKFTGVGDAHDDQVDATANGWNIARDPVSLYDVL